MIWNKRKMPDTNLRQEDNIKRYGSLTKLICKFSLVLIDPLDNFIELENGS